MKEGCPLVDPRELLRFEQQRVIDVEGGSHASNVHHLMPPHNITAWPALPKRD